LSQYIAVYDLAVSPVSYDFTTFLALAAGNAAQAGLPLHVAIEPRRDGDFEGPDFCREWGGYGAAEARWRLWNIVIPACALANATVELRRERGGPGHRLTHHQGELLRLAREGFRFPPLRASDYAHQAIEARIGRPLITITLRYDRKDPARNSRADDWHRAASVMRLAGYRVDVLDDVGLLAEGEDAADVALSVDLRLALYERAAMNFFVANGPAGLCWYSTAPFMSFNCRLGGEAWAKHWDDMGLPEGAQLPWAAADQILVYRPDTVPEIIGAFDAWHRARAAA
jgi:hypothetical protein